MALNECQLLKSRHRKMHIENLVSLIEHSWRDGVIRLTKAQTFYPKEKKQVILDVPIEYAEELSFQLEVSGFTVIYPEVILKS